MRFNYLKLLNFKSTATLPSLEKVRVFFKGFEHFEGKMDISLSEASLLKRTRDPEKLCSVFDKIRTSFGIGNEPLNFVGRVESQGKKGIVTLGGTVKSGNQDIGQITMFVNNAGESPIIKLVSKSEISNMDIAMDFNERLLPLNEATITSSLKGGKSRDYINMGGLKIRNVADVNRQMQLPIIEKLQPLFAELQSGWLGIFKSPKERASIRATEYRARGLMTPEAKVEYEKTKTICDGTISVKPIYNPELTELNNNLRMAEIIMQNGEMPNYLAEKLRDPNVFDKVAKYIGDVKLDQTIQNMLG